MDIDACIFTKILVSPRRTVLAVRMNTDSSTDEKKVARVAVDVRLYFDVPIKSEEPAAIQRAALQELGRVAYDELLRVKKLRFANVYLGGKWPTMRPDDFQICQICSVREANSETRFAL